MNIMHFESEIKNNLHCILHPLFIVNVMVEFLQIFYKRTHKKINKWDV